MTKGYWQGTVVGKGLTPGDQTGDFFCGFQCKVENTVSCLYILKNSLLLLCSNLKPSSHLIWKSYSVCTLDAFSLLFLWKGPPAKLCCPGPHKMLIHTWQFGGGGKVFQCHCHLLFFFPFVCLVDWWRLGYLRLARKSLTFYFLLTSSVFQDSCCLWARMLLSKRAQPNLVYLYKYVNRYI